MSLTIAPSADDAERWRQWQVANAMSNRKSATQARVVFAVLFTGVIGWVGWLLSSQPWA